VNARHDAFVRCDRRASRDVNGYPLPGTLAPNRCAQAKGRGCQRVRTTCVRRWIGGRFRLRSGRLRLPAIAGNRAERRRGQGPGQAVRAPSTTRSAATTLSCWH